MSISAYKLSGGQTRYRVRFTRPDGTRSDKRGFTTKTAARKWEASIITGQTSTPQRGEQPIRTYADLYLKTLVGKSANTIDSLTITLNKHVLPRWGATLPSQVTHPNVQQWITEQANSNSQATRNLSVLSRLLRLAGIKKQDLPTTDITKPAKASARNVYLTWPQLQILAKAAKHHKGIVLTLGLVGMRWGELAGLQVKDWNPHERTLIIRQSATIVRGRLVLGPTKSKRSRTVVVPEAAATHINKAVARRSGESPIWPRPNGDYMLRPKGKSWWYGALKRAQEIDPLLPTLRIHDLRHTAASLMVQSGAHVKLIQHQLGHASAAMTLDTYADLFPEDLAALQLAMNRKFCGHEVGTGHSQDTVLTA